MGGIKALPGIVIFQTAQVLSLLIRRTVLSGIERSGGSVASPTEPLALGFYNTRPILIKPISN